VTLKEEASISEKMCELLTLARDLAIKCDMVFLASLIDMAAVEAVMADSGPAQRDNFSVMLSTTRH
jgi:hypothetical protein